MRTVFLQLIIVTSKIERAVENRFESNLPATLLATVPLCGTCCCIRLENVFVLVMEMRIVNPHIGSIYSV